VANAPSFFVPFHEDFEMKKIALFALLPMLAFGLAACEPEVGSKEWCQAMKEKPKADWSVNEAADFAKNCVLTSE